MLFISYSKMARIRIHTRRHTKEKPYEINSYFFGKLVGQKKKSKGWAKYLFLCKICAEGISFVFSLVTKQMKNWSKIAFFFPKWTPFRTCIPKRNTITFYRRKLSKLHEKDTILHVTITLFLKQGQTRASSWPITVPLMRSLLAAAFCVKKWSNFVWIYGSEYQWK